MSSSLSFRVQPPIKEDLHDARRMKQYTTVSNDILPLKENWGGRWCMLPSTFETVLADILNFSVRESDVFVVTFIKCGTTWMQETAWLLLNNLNFAEAKNKCITERSLFIDWAGLYEGTANTIKICEEQPEPRLIKSHLPAHLLPKELWLNKRKVIYVARNVKDVVVSSYVFLKSIGNWIGTLDEFIDEFINDEVIYSSYWSHIIDFWRMRNEPNVFFITYEEMKRDLAVVLQRLCVFLDRQPLEDTEIQQLLDHLSFESMKTNRQTNITDQLKRDMPLKVDENFQFMRRGVIGSFRDELSAKQRQTLDDWTSQVLKKYDIVESDIFGTIE